MPQKSSTWYAPPLAQWLKQTDDLAPLRAGMEQVASLEGELPQLLPDYLAASVEPGIIKGTTLVLFVAHSALAARLRQLEPGIIAGLQARGRAVDALQIRVRPPSLPSAVPPKEAQMSHAGVAAISALSEALEPSPLRDALKAMALRYRSLSQEQE